MERQLKDRVTQLAAAVAHFAGEGLTSTPLANLALLKVSQCTDLPPEVYRPVVSLIVQGEKQLVIGSELLTYQAGDTFTAAVDLPVRARITEASRERPYLAIRFTIDTATIVMLRSRAAHMAPATAKRGFSVDAASPDLLDAFNRALRLCASPEDAPVMAPLLEQEILYRLLSGPQGEALSPLVAGDRRSAQITHALDIIRRRYRETFRIEEIARTVGMSVSAFHRRFRAVTRMTPLQYQKALRLYDARTLLLTGKAGASLAAFSVGYESVSQFSREYRRLFGAPPLRDARQTGAQHSSAEVPSMRQTTRPVAHRDEVVGRR